MTHTDWQTHRQTNRQIDRQVLEVDTCPVLHFSVRTLDRLHQPNS